uniref:Retrovirus-related Pol polyprotein from transposon gypsy n=1 Tax=Cajanus cajan TaxID=3821 RepID=A0A151T8T1_CAJCA|nr:Retrovirus-related Pol polyprotein from transposon gypsy [Cajanus cajan]
MLVDNTAINTIFLFVDGYLGYNQIKMTIKDHEKTFFITPWGTFCYKVMPFELKNVGATYQRAMVTLFHDMIHKEVEVYVDDMIAKSNSEHDHLVHLKKLFNTFGVRSGKFLRFIVSEKGIEVDPDKAKAIIKMPTPKTKKEVRGFLGRVNYIAHFISQLTDTCTPIFKLLRSSIQRHEVQAHCLTIDEETDGHPWYYIEGGKYLAEASNNDKKTIRCRAIRFSSNVQKMVITYKDWHKMLPFTLHGYRTSVRTLTNTTPFSLVYGMEAVLPIKVEIPSLRLL